MKTYTITFSDGTKLEKLTLNPGANTFHSPASFRKYTLPPATAI